MITTKKKSYTAAFEPGTVALSAERAIHYATKASIMALQKYSINLFSLKRTHLYTISSKGLAYFESIKTNKYQSCVHFKNQILKCELSKVFSPSLPPKYYFNDFFKSTCFV